MSVYLGNAGQIELTRSAPENTSFDATVASANVSVAVGRFQLNGVDQSLLITGDLVEFKATSGVLAFIDSSGWSNNTVQAAGSWYIYVDEIGGIKLYDSFANSLNGESTGRIALTPITADISVTVSLLNHETRLLASVTDFEINTNREVVDITCLSDMHRSQYSSLITGSGSLVAFWDYIGDGTEETVQYLMQLVQRTEIGSQFKGKFYIKRNGTAAASGTFSSAQLNDSLWWEFDAIVVNSAVNFTPDSIISGRINFIATGPIRLRAQATPPERLLKEDDDLVLQQNNASILLEGSGGATQANPVVNLTLSSASFTNGSAIGSVYFFNDAGCTGTNISPQLTWVASGADAGDIATYDLRCVDLSAANFIHWSVDDIPSTTTSIAESGSWPVAATVNQNDWEPLGYTVDANGWGGPCPPATHTYQITITARNSAGTALATATLSFTATQSYNAQQGGSYLQSQRGMTHG